MPQSVPPSEPVSAEQPQLSPRAPLNWLLLGPIARECATWGDAPQHLLQQLRAVQPQVGLFQLDLPGTGRLCGERSPDRIEDLVDGLRGRVRAAALPGPWGLMASSWASCVAAEWARRYPDELGAIVLVSPAMRPFTKVLRSVPTGLWGQALTKLLGRRAFWRRDAVVWNGQTQLRRASADSLSRWRELRRQHPVRARNGWRQMMAVWRFETSKRRPHPHVLLLAGKGDAWIDWRVSAAISRAWGAAVRVHPEAGHDLLLDDPQWVGRSVAEWLLPIGSSGLISQL